MTLLNNYYILRSASSKRLVSLGPSASAITRTWLNAVGDKSLDKLLTLKSPVGKTLKAMVGNEINYISPDGSGYDIGGLINLNISTIGHTWIGIQGDVSYGDYYTDSTGGSTTSRICNTWQFIKQTPLDISPFCVTYTQYAKGRLSEYILPASGLENDNEPVSLYDYKLENPLYKDVIEVTVTSSNTDGLTINFYNCSNAVQTIRQIGIFDPRIRIATCYTSTDTTIDAITQEQKEIINNAFGQVTGMELYYSPITLNTFTNVSSRYAETCIPILYSKTKLTTPIVLQPGESKKILYTIKA